MEIKIGVVEDNVDPMKLGRCRVRIFGLHTEDRALYPTEDLPWAIFLSQSTSISGQGNSFVLNQGDWVALTFMDPEMQKPIILGVIPRFVESLPDFGSGFSDPDSTNPDSDFVGESNISRLARNENIADTIIQDKKDDRTTGVQCVAVTWDEPETPYAAEYPENKVIQTKDHVIELDDTDGAERVHIYHKSGTSVETHPNGDQVELIKADKYVVISSDNNVLVKGKYNTRIESDSNKEIVGDSNMEVGGASTIDVTTNSTENVGGNKLIDSDGSTNIDAGTSAEMKAATTADIDAGTSATISAGTTITISASGNVTITAGGTVTITGTSISLN